LGSLGLCVELRLGNPSLSREVILSPRRKVPFLLPRSSRVGRAPFDHDPGVASRDGRRLEPGHSLRRKSDEVLCTTVASIGWFDLGGDFAQRALLMARLGHSSPLSARTRTLMVQLLEALRHYYKNVDEVNRFELDALGMIMSYADHPGRPDDEYSRHRAEYVRVLCEYENLVLREVELQRAGGDTDWLGAGESVELHLGILVASDLREAMIARALEMSGVTAVDLIAGASPRREAVRQARAHHKRGDTAEAVRLLRTVFPSNKPSWVFIEDLYVLGLWLRLSRTLGAVERNLLRAVAGGLRRLTLRYIGQFSVTIPELQVQRLAVALSDAIELGSRRLPERSLSVSP
jgi:hypothetical protein